ncbi:MAG: hypothetical protein AB7U83_05515 [Vicinamibacterales bacterium]
MRRRAVAVVAVLSPALAVVAVGIVTAWTIAAVPESRLGWVASIGPPRLAAAMAAAAGLLIWARTAQWACAWPLAVGLAPLVAPTVPGAWLYAGAGGAMAVAVCLVATLRSVPAPATLTAVRPRHHAVAAAAIAVAWLGGVAAAVAPHALTGDAPHYLTIARSLLRDGDVDLANDYDTRTYGDFYAGSLEPRHTNTSPWGEQYPFHGLGTAVLVAPAFAVWGVAGATATLVLLMAAGAAMCWLAAWELWRNAGAAWVGWAGLVLSAPFALQAAAIYPDGPAAVAVAGVLWLLARLQGATPVSLAAFAATGLGLATLPWLHARLALPAGVLGLAVLVATWRGQPDRWTRMAWFLTVPVISLAGWVGAAQVMFGTWNPAAAILQRTAPGGWADLARGLVGLAADQEYGLLPAAPALAVALWAAPGFVRAFPLVGAATAVASAGVLLMSSLWVWWGGDSAPARFLTVVLPALALWLARGWSVAGPGGRRVVVLGVTVNAALTLLYATVDGGARAYTFPDGLGSVFSAFSDSVDLGLAMPSLFRTDLSFSTACLLALVWASGGLVAAAMVARLPARREGAATALGGLVLCVVGLLTATAGWQVAGRAPWTSAGGRLAWYRHAASQGSAGLGLDGWRLRPLDDVAMRLGLRTPESVPIRPPVLLHLPDLPAGRYALRTAAPPGATATLRLELGRDAWPFAEWPLSASPPPLVLRSALHSVRVTGDAPPGTTVWLEPRGVDRRAPRGQARRVTRFGDVAVYSMDDQAYVDADGLWTGANRTARLLIAPLAPMRGLALIVEAGPAGVDVEMPPPHGVGTLAPHERRIVALHSADPTDLVDLHVTVRGGFPAAALGNPADSRTFGVRLTVRASAP